MKIFICEACNLLFNQANRKPMYLSCGDVICQECLHFKLKQLSNNEQYFLCPGDEQHQIQKDSNFIKNLHLLKHMSSSDFLNMQCDMHQDKLVEKYCRYTQKLMCNECILSCNHSLQSEGHLKVTRKGIENYAQSVIPKLQDLLERIQSLIMNFINFKNKDKLFLGSDIVKMANQVKEIFTIGAIKQIQQPQQERIQQKEESKSIDESDDSTTSKPSHFYEECLDIETYLEKSSDNEHQVVQINTTIQSKNQQEQEEESKTQEIKQEQIPKQKLALNQLEADPYYANYRKLVDFQITTQEVFLVRDKILDQKFLRFQMIYKGTRDGFSSKVFHQFCNTQGPTISFILNEFGYVFGGYASVHWNSNNQYVSDDKAFLFSLTRKSKHLVNAQVAHATFHKDTHGWTQGGSHDLHISSDCNINSDSYSNLGHTFQVPDGYVYGQENTRQYLVGGLKFKVIEIEVYRVLYV
ncbi:tldc domain-containing protein [Stylonychia lemnae]|uniref:Tldc domain-containing protein n=1 Tax=Stylonychia lemnae TaxID=5949 RepID=A0A078ADV4_STYLE|nr:tldc domain-containing protein [Stylonychia lemnae]|eukprot:CDW80390.1 tldc domain-containing protein [Stylonychia lemnae]